MSFKKICVVGLGYIGLPTAAMFASKNLTVYGVDINETIVNKLNKGEVLIEEPGLESLVSDVVAKGYLSATIKPLPSDAFIIAVPTPMRFSGGSIPIPDTDYIRAAAKSIAPVLKRGNLVVLESTSPVGTTEMLLEWLSEERRDLNFETSADIEADINIAYCPERILPGKMLSELVENGRIIGGMSNICCDRAVELYKTFVVGECVPTTPRLAEMTKLTENACRDVQLAFANELSIICDKSDINVWELIAMANRHPRIHILQPGPGVGGHCIAVDPWFIVSQNPEESQLIHQARIVNNHKPHWVYSKIKSVISDIVKSQILKNEGQIKIILYGLSYKPDVDDFRESPALQIAEWLNKETECKIVGIEPYCKSSEFSFEVLDTLKCTQAADIHVMLVPHKEFLGLSRPKGYVVDTCGLWQ